MWKRRLKLSATPPEKLVKKAVPPWIVAEQIL
jgi:hypothetical protein